MSTEQNQAPANVFLDHCWADTITYTGLGLSIMAARAIHRKKYLQAAVFTAGASLADWWDGWEARRFTRRHPEQGAARQAKSAFKDQLADRLRNLAIVGSLIANEDVATQVKPKLKMIAGREAFTLAGAATGAYRFRRHGGGIPKTPPSPPAGREAVWWIAVGAGASIVGAHCRANQHSQAEAAFTTLADSLLTAGVVRSAQATVEAGLALRQMNQAEQTGAADWQPSYTPHVGTLVMRGVRSVMAWRHPAGEATV